MEDHIAATCETFVIVRLARVHGLDVSDVSGYEGWATAVRNDEEVVCADDQIISPACRDDAVEGLARLVERGLGGIYNLSGERPIRRVAITPRRGVPK